jgi:hypothetical protein
MEGLMRSTVEQAWVSLTNSGRYRRLAKYGLGSTILRSDAYRRLIMAKNYITTYPSSRLNGGDYRDLAVFCTFIGPTKSGSTMVGSLLDAHPEAIFADEVDALRYVDAGFNRLQIADILLRRSRRQAMIGRVTARRLAAYNFEVPGQWQGRYRTLRVMGDSKAGMSTRRLGRKPGLLARTERVMKEAEAHYIMVIRNPFDPITAMRIRGRRSTANAIQRYFENCAHLKTLRQAIDPSRLFLVRYEEFVARPQTMLSDLCHFLGLQADQAYLDACAAIIYDKPEQMRDQLEWPAEDRQAVLRQSASYDFLAGYTFEN